MYKYYYEKDSALERHGWADQTATPKLKQRFLINNYMPNFNRSTAVLVSSSQLLAPNIYDLTTKLSQPLQIVTLVFLVFIFSIYFILKEISCLSSSIYVHCSAELIPNGVGNRGIGILNTSLLCSPNMGSVVGGFVFIL